MGSSFNTLALLRKYESQNILYAEPDGSWPIVWDRAAGVHVWDERGRKYLDLTAAFGVAAAGHANPRIVQAAQRQMKRLLHAMGDVHPHARKAELARELSALTFERWSVANTKSSRSIGKTIFCNSGFEAVEAALKTALLATGRKGIIAFQGGYHGLGYGALNVTHRPEFRSPFASQLRNFGHFLPFPSAPTLQRGTKQSGARLALEQLDERMRQLFRRRDIGAVVVEPLQGRGGIRVPPPDFLPLLRNVCDEHGALLVVDEIFTGFGRTGRWFACEHSGTVPDLICLGKALTGGFPLSACVGKSSLMDRAWPKSTGEAIHTSTFLGHPVGCAMALAQIKEITTHKLVQRSQALGTLLQGSLQKLAGLRPDLVSRARGCGLMAGIEWSPRIRPLAPISVMPLVKELLGQGFIFLPEGAHGEVLSFTPPLTITAPQLETAVGAIATALKDKRAFS